MESMKLKCPVTIKAKVTADLKKNMLENIQTNLKNVELDLQQMEIQAKRAIEEQAQRDLQGVEPLRQHIEMERQKRLEFKQQMLSQEQEAEHLEIGAEIVQGTLEQIIEVKVGDDMKELMNTEILVEDGKIIAFRS